ncbi:MAG: restriction endonuclease subunit S [Terrimicrobiaceae bacterium]
MEYTQLTVAIKGRGIRERQKRLGKEIKTKHQFRVRKGQFVFSRIDARNGAFGIVPESLDGAIVSTDFPSFTFDEKLADPRFFTLYASTSGFIERCRLASRGVTNRKRLKEHQFLSIALPLPPRPEQERIADILEHALARVSEARHLQESATDESRQFLAELAIRSDLSDAAKTKSGWRRRRLDSIITEAGQMTKVEKGKLYPNIGIFSYARGLFAKPDIDPETSKAERLYRIRKGQFIYSRLFAFEGAYGYVPDWADGKFVSGEFPSFDCDPEAVLSEFLFCYFKSEDVWKKLRDECKGMGGRRIRLREPSFLAHELWLPPVAYQRTVKTAVESLESAATLQRDFPVELEALQSSLLDQAFSGNL